MHAQTNPLQRVYDCVRCACANSRTRHTKTRLEATLPFRTLEMQLQFLCTRACSQAVACFHQPRLMHMHVLYFCYVRHAHAHMHALHNVHMRVP